MKKVISTIAAISLSVSMFTFNNNANSAQDLTFYYDDNKEVIVSRGNFTDDELQYIADFVVYGNGDVSVQRTICNNHNLSTTYSYETTHNVYTTSPKCVQKRYKVTKCTRCDYITKTLISSQRTSSCHG